MKESKKKYQIFISSTYLDLKEEREAAVEAILKAGHIPAGMELFKSGKAQWDTIKKWIDNSDIYILILGGRYGSIDQESGLSYTHKEYEYAISKKIPVLSIIMDELLIKEKINQGIEIKNLIETDNKQNYIKFKDMVLKKIVSFAKNTSEVKLAIHENINQFQDEYALRGWVRGEEFGDKQELLSEINKLRIEKENLIEENKELKKEINQIKEKNTSKSAQFEKFAYKEEFKINGIIRELYSNEKIQLNCSWEYIFSLWGPKLYESVNSISAKKLLEKSLEEEFDISPTFIMNSKSYDIIKIQFIALELIKNFNAKSVKGGVYEFVTLTEYGKQKLIETLSIKKNQNK